MLSLAGIRDIAERHEYKEIEHNRRSRLISFRDTRGGSTRINVYYTTGTVGTCLNHPRRGKTQLFRRNITNLVLLEEIFINPRVHTNGGYYRNKTSQQWQKEDSHNGESQRDSARRWQYVGRATGLVHNDREMKTITDICTEWDDLVEIARPRFRCGPKCGLMQMLDGVASETLGQFGIIHRPNGKMEFLPGDFFFDATCGREVAFFEVYANDVRRLEHKFKSLRKDARIALMQWFLGREMVGASFADMNGAIIKTRYSDAVTDAHVEYGELAYAKSAVLCPRYGVEYGYQHYHYGGTLVMA